MTTLEMLRSQLNACKGSDRWARIATLAGCHYFTVARISRGAIENPGIVLVDRLFEAVKSTEPAKDAV